MGHIRMICIAERQDWVGWPQWAWIMYSMSHDRCETSRAVLMANAYRRAATEAIPSILSKIENYPPQPVAPSRPAGAHHGSTARRPARRLPLVDEAAGIESATARTLR